MNVPNIGQGSGSVETLSRPQPDIEVQPETTRENPGSAPNPVVQAAKVKDDVDFARIGWFDANGDGRIDSRSSTYGGDGTLLLPAHSVIVPTYARVVARPTASGSITAAQPPADVGKAPAPPTNDAQTRQAVAAYARYGQTPSSASTNQAQT